MHVAARICARRARLVLRGLDPRGAVVRAPAPRPRGSPRGGGSAAAPRRGRRGRPVRPGAAALRHVPWDPDDDRGSITGAGAAAAPGDARPARLPRGAAARRAAAPEHRLRERAAAVRRGLLPRALRRAAVPRGSGRRRRDPRAPRGAVTRSDPVVASRAAATTTRRSSRSRRRAGSRTVDVADTSAIRRSWSLAGARLRVAAARATTARSRTTTRSGPPTTWTRSCAPSTPRGRWRSRPSCARRCCCGRTRCRATAAPRCCARRRSARSRRRVRWSPRSRGPSTAPPGCTTSRRTGHGPADFGDWRIGPQRRWCLCACVARLGNTTAAGHYIATVRRGDDWYAYDDTSFGGHLVQNLRSREATVDSVGTIMRDHGELFMYALSSPPDPAPTATAASRTPAAAAVAAGPAAVASGPAASA